MSQTAVPFLFMRAGTSRGPFMNRADLPDDLDKLAEVLIAVIGSGHPLNIDGLGGGAPVTTKVAMLSRSDDDWAEIDYFFAQVSVQDRMVDFKPTCGNILSAVGPAAIEMGLIAPKGDTTSINIRAVNTGARIVATIDAPNGAVTYVGDTAIDGVPGTAAPIELQFKDVVGGLTGALLPTGNLTDVIDGLTVTCMDVAMPMVIARAEDFGLTGYEDPAELDENKEFFARMEPIRIEAGKRMGLGDVSKSVVPKFGLLVPAKSGGTISARYFTPWKCHPTMAVTGSQCLASCVLTPGTIADGMAIVVGASPASITLEHAQGHMAVLVDYEIDQGNFKLNAAGVVRTARKIAAGQVFVPDSVWSGV